MSASVHHAEAQAKVKRYSLWSAGFGLIPVPLIDMAAILALQVKMVRDLAHLYEQNWPEARVRAAIASLIGSATPVAVGVGASSVLKGIPLLGQIVGVLAVPALAAAATTALGRVFVVHFETGGTLLDFDAEKMRAFFDAEFEKARGELLGKAA